MKDSMLLSIDGLRKAYAGKAVSPVEVMRHTIGQINALNPELNFVYEMHEEEALRMAAESERRWMAGRPAGLLDGIPATIKDALPLAGYCSYRGTAAEDPDPVPSTTDAPCVARLKEEGAIAFGKTTMCDLGILPSGTGSSYGVTRNPWNPARNPGGSSAGAAASVAAAVHPFAIGTDIVGSIRLPAAWSGIYGFKPSQGRVPYYFPNSPSLVAGPMTHSVRDAAELMNIIARPDPRDFAALAYDGFDYLAQLDAPIKPGRIGIVRDLGFDAKPDTESLGVLDAAAAILKSMGWEIRDIAPPCTQQDLLAAENFYRVRAYAELKTKPMARREKAAVVNGWASAAASASASDFYDWFNTLQRCREQVVSMMRYVDYLLLPPTLTAAPEAEFPRSAADALFVPWAQTYLFNLSEQPAASVPMRLSGAGLPLGVQIVGRRFDDAGVLRLSARLEAARGRFPLSPYAQRGIQGFNERLNEIARG
ncbi:MAG TPA: amidase family protein [Bordetella sp.]